MKICKEDLNQIHKIVENLGGSPERPLLLLVPSSLAIQSLIYQYIYTYGTLDIKVETLKTFGEEILTESGQVLPQNLEDLYLSRLWGNGEDFSEESTRIGLSLGNLYREVKGRGIDQSYLPKKGLWVRILDVFQTWDKYLGKHQYYSEGDLYRKSCEKLNIKGYCGLCFFHCLKPKVEEEPFVQRLVDSFQDIFIISYGEEDWLPINAKRILSKARDPKITLFSANHFREEIQEVFRNILFHYQDGIPLKNHKIVVRNKNTMAFIESYGRKYGIPLVNAVSRPVDELPPGREYLHLLEFFTNPKEDHIKKRLDLFYFPFKDISKEALGILKTMTFHSLEDALNKLKSLDSWEGELSTYEEVKDAIEVLIEEVQVFGKDPRSWSLIFKNYNCYQRILEKGNPYFHRDLKSLELIEKLYEPLEREATLFLNISKEEWFFYIKERLSKEVIREDQFQDGVFVCGPEEALGTYSTFTYLLEMNEDLPKKREYHFLLTEQLQEDLGIKLPLSEEAYYEERRLENILKNSENVQISFTKNRPDDTGSFLLQNVNFKPYIVPRSNPDMAITKEEWEEWYIENLGQTIDGNSIFSSKEGGPFDLPPCNIKSLSPTALESYGKCPFAFYMTYVLQANPKIEQDDYLVLGNLFHKILEEYYQGLKKGKEIIYNQEYLNFTIERNIKRNENFKEDYFQLEYLKNKCHRFVQEDVLRMKKEGFLPIAFEKPFTFTLLDQEFYGRIDRIDITKEGYLVLMDYKSSKYGLPGVRNIWTKEEYQLPIYYLSEVLGGKKVVGALYGVLKTSEFIYPIRNLEYLSKEWSGQKSTEELNYWMSEKLKQIEERLSEMEKNYFAPIPRECSPYCPYQYMCRKEEYLEL
ncbi:MAG: PD-(D/E)XK nuclease family protein [Tissierellia bacterium]|nr:PD-(D/E)XK nuclease family protein [Tissierellia bacterium]